MVDIKSRMSYDASIYFIRGDKLVLTVGVELSTTALRLLVAKDGVLIWEHHGSYKLIPTAILRNIITRYETARAISASYPRIKPPKDLMLIDWNQGWYVKPEIAEALLLVPRNHSDELGNTDSTTNPTTEG